MELLGPQGFAASTGRSRGRALRRAARGAERALGDALLRGAAQARGLGANRPGRARRWTLPEIDRRLFHTVAARDWPGAESTLPRLSRAADRSRLWLGMAAGIAASRSPRGARSAVRGLASIGFASAVVTPLGKRYVGRARPVLETVPLVRRLKRQPFTSSFPSGHAASAAAFATGVALESPRWGAAVAPLAAAVAFSRVYTGVHYPSDVLAGSAIGVCAALAVRGIAPTRSQLPAPGRPLAQAPALPSGAGLVLVGNVGSGGRAGGQPGEPTELGAVRQLLPEAEIIVCDPSEEDLGEVLEQAARRAAAHGGALGVHGGDGTLNAAAGAALRAGVPLAVVPGGTRNHFTQDLGVETPVDTCRAVQAGEAVSVDLGRFRDLEAAEGEDPARDGYFLNTFSLGTYPELVRIRERWAPRLGAWSAGVLAAVHVLRTGSPVHAGLGGEYRTLWLLFAGNCAYRAGLAPVRRRDLTDGQLDVRLVDAGNWPRLRLLVAALTSAVDRSPVHTTARLRQLVISDIPDGSHLAYDGEVAPAPARLLLDKRHEALTVYRSVLD